MWDMFRFFKSYVFEFKIIKECLFIDVVNVMSFNFFIGPKLLNMKPCVIMPKSKTGKDIISGVFEWFSQIVTSDISSVLQCILYSYFNFF